MVALQRSFSWILTLTRLGKIILEHHIENCVEKTVKYGAAKKSIRGLKEAPDQFVLYVRGVFKAEHIKKRRNSLNGRQR